MYYSYVEIEYVAMSFSPARMDLAVKLLMPLLDPGFKVVGSYPVYNLMQHPIPNLTLLPLTNHIHNCILSSLHHV
jgi:hypothetical protein